MAYLQIWNEPNGVKYLNNFAIVFKKLNFTQKILNLIIMHFKEF